MSDRIYRTDSHSTYRHTHIHRMPDKETKGLTAHLCPSLSLSLSFYSMALSHLLSVMLNAMTIAIIVNCQMALTICCCSCSRCCSLHLPARSIVCVGVEICKWKRKGEKGQSKKGYTIDERKGKWKKRLKPSWLDICCFDLVNEIKEQSEISRQCANLLCIPYTLYIPYKQSESTWTLEAVEQDIWKFV